MDENNQCFESFLREFHPRRPRALPVSTSVAPVSARRLAAAAVVTISLATSLWLLLRALTHHQTRLVDGQQAAASAKQPVREPLSTIALTRLVLENPKGLDAALPVTRENRLPRFDRQNSVLRVLAQE
jgi:hypothetical protein